MEVRSYHIHDDSERELPTGTDISFPGQFLITSRKIDDELRNKSCTLVNCHLGRLYFDHEFSMDDISSIISDLESRVKVYPQSIESEYHAQRAKVIASLMVLVRDSKSPSFQAESIINLMKGSTDRLSLITAIKSMESSIKERTDRIFTNQN